MQFFSARKNGCVYMIVDNNGIAKIGGADNINKRVSNLLRKNVGASLFVEIHAVHHMYLEKFIHIHLKDKEVLREWYRDVREVKDRLIDFAIKHGSVFGVYALYVHNPPVRLKTKKFEIVG